MIINNKNYIWKINDETYHCAMDLSMTFIGGKWKTIVLWYLKEKTLRFGELKKQIPQITEKMLSIQLKQLEEDGLIKRQAYIEVPLRVEYSLTEFGQTLIPVLDAVSKWGRSYGEKFGTIEEVI